MFIPEMASKCARLLSRSALTVSRLMPDLSPVITPLANAPASPGICAIIACDSRVRRRLITCAPSFGSSHNITGLRV